MEADVSGSLFSGLIGRWRRLIAKQFIRYHGLIFSHNAGQYHVLAVLGLLVFGGYLIWNKHSVSGVHDNCIVDVWLVTSHISNDLCRPVLDSHPLVVQEGASFKPRSRDGKTRR